MPTNRDDTNETTNTTESAGLKRSTDSASEVQLQASRAAGKASEAPMTGGTSGSTLSAEELDGMSKEELAAEADKRGVTVTRADGEEGTPLKQDYIDALSK